jgi:uncharacterized protein YndB with AHSA1/START domain
VIDVPAAVRRSILVNRPIDVAFKAWFQTIDSWWPKKDHSLSGSADTEVFLQAKAGGRIYERTTDGAELEWGRVLAVERPHRITYLWYLGSDEENPTEVTVSFTERAPRSTQVRVVHRGPELLGAVWNECHAGFAANWDKVLAAFEERPET